MRAFVCQVGSWCNAGFFFVDFFLSAEHNDADYEIDRSLALEIRLTSVLGNSQKLDGGSMFGNAPRTVWNGWVEADERGRIDLNCRCLLVEAGGLKVLCETGIGAFFEPKLAERYGVQDPERHVLRENLQASGFLPGEIDYVILSHLHFDHAGGLLPTYAEIQQGDQGLIFPKAQFVVGARAWQRAQNPHLRDRASFIPGLCDKLEKSGRLLVVDEGQVPKELAGSLNFTITDGHTPGQLHSWFGSGTGTVFFAGDLIPGQAWIHLPITMGYDRFPEQLIDEKEDILRRIVAERTLVFFTHDTRWAAAYIDCDKNGRYVLAQGFASLKDWPLI